MRACGFQRHKHGATKSDEDDQKHHTETSHVTVDDLGKSLGIQTSSSRRKTNIDLTQAKKIEQQKQVKGNLKTSAFS